MNLNLCCSILWKECYLYYFQTTITSIIWQPFSNITETLCPFPLFNRKFGTVSHNCYFFLYNFQFPYSFPGFNSLFLHKMSVVLTVSLLILRTLSQVLHFQNSSKENYFYHIIQYSIDVNMTHSVSSPAEILSP